MITCKLQLRDDIDDLYKIFLSETLKSERANCNITKNKLLTFEVTAKDPIAMKAFLTSILNIVQTYYKIK